MHIGDLDIVAMQCLVLDIGKVPEETAQRIKQSIESKFDAFRKQLNGAKDYLKYYESMYKAVRRTNGKRRSC